MFCSVCKSGVTDFDNISIDLNYSLLFQYVPENPIKASFASAPGNSAVSAGATETNTTDTNSAIEIGFEKTTTSGSRKSFPIIGTLVLKGKDLKAQKVKSSKNDCYKTF